MRARSVIVAAVSLAAVACSADATRLRGAGDDASTRDASAPDVETDDGTTMDAGAVDGGAVDGDAEVRDASPCGATAGNALTGMQIATYVTDRGELNVPDDLSDDRFAVFVEQSSGDFVEYPVTTLADGTFFACGLPAGPYYLRAHERPHVVFVTDALAVDLGYAIIGRADVVEQESWTTNIRFDVTDMTSWQEGDNIELMSTNSHGFAFGVQRNAMPPLEVGTTTASFVLPWNGRTTYGPSVIDAAKGDSAFLTHFVTKTLPNGERYHSLADIFWPAPFTMVDGETTTLTGAFEHPPVRTIALDWRRSAFEAIAHELAVETSSSSHWLWMMGMPSPERGFYDAAPTVLDLHQGLPSDLSAVLEYADALPQNLELVAFASVTHTASISLMGGQAWSTGLLQTAAFVPVTPGVPLVLEPLIGPAHNLTIDGRDANDEQIGVGLTPLIEWTPPLFSVASSYDVHIYVPTPDGLGWRGVIRTARTRVRVPPGFLQRGTTYVAVISSRFESVDFAHHPRRGSLPEAWSETMTAPFTP